jgi:Yip1 domain
MSLPARFVGIVTSPRETFQAVVAHPRWFGMLAVVTLVMALLAALPMTTEAGKEAALQQQVEQAEAWGRTIDDQAYEGMRRGMAFAPYFTAGALLVFGPIFTLIVAGILFVVFNAVMGGDASFKQLFAVVVHGSVISALQQLFTGPLNYFKGAVTSATNLTALLPIVDPKTFMGRVMSMVDLFMIWYVLILAIGLGVLYRRRTQPIAMTLYGVYAVLVLCFAALMSSFGGA